MGMLLGLGNLLRFRVEINGVPCCYCTHHFQMVLGKYKLARNFASLILVCQLKLAVTLTIFKSGNLSADLFLPFLINTEPLKYKVIQNWGNVDQEG